jgi:hypothetical protein
MTTPPALPKWSIEGREIRSSAVWGAAHVSTGTLMLHGLVQQANAAADLQAALIPLLFEMEQILISTKNFPECAVKMSRRCACEQAQTALKSLSNP